MNLRKTAYSRRGLYCHRTKRPIPIEFFAAALGSGVTKLYFRCPRCGRMHSRKTRYLFGLDDLNPPPSRLRTLVRR